MSFQHTDGYVITPKDSGFVFRYRGTPTFSVIARNDWIAEYVYLQPTYCDFSARAKVREIVELNWITRTNKGENRMQFPQERWEVLRGNIKEITGLQPTNKEK